MPQPNNTPRIPSQRRQGSSSARRPSNNQPQQSGSYGTPQMRPAQPSAQPAPQQRPQQPMPSPRQQSQHKPTSPQRPQQRINVDTAQQSTQETPRGGIGQRLSNLSENLQTGRSIREMFSGLLDWIYDHSLMFLAIVGIVALIIGVAFNRYISFGAGLFLVILGYIMSLLDSGKDTFWFYIVGLVIFVIPFVIV